MAWNPTPEVAAVRDAARKLNTQFAVMVYVTHNGELGVTSYGETKALCDKAAGFAEHLRKAANEWGE